MHIERVGDVRCGLGEGPVWDVAEQALYFTDVLARKIRRHDPADHSFAEWSTPHTVSSLALEDSGVALIAMSNGVYRFDFKAGVAKLIADPEKDKPVTILNDGKADRRGRFLFGSVTTDHVSAVCGLYKMEHDVVTRLDEGFTISNGPCWSPDGRVFYVADSAPNFRIYAYDYDLDTGTLANKRVFAATRELGGIPDGATVDSEGRLWTAICGGGKVACYAANGQLVQVIDVPPRLASSVMFGGPDLDHLYVTSIDPSSLPFDAGAKDDAGGFLYVITGLDAHGLPEPRYRRDLTSAAASAGV